MEKAVRAAGGVSKLARLLGVTAPTVHEWKTSKRPVPAARCSAIVRVTNGAVTLQELRPADWQDYWPELANAERKVA